MDFTGERMVPEQVVLSLFWEHVFRYRFAARHARRKTVLDIASGEGYGCHILKQAGASQVIGVDLSPEAVAHARSKYGIDARVGNAEAIPLPDQSVDLVVSFETVEHVPHPDRFVAEISRVLKPGGRLVMSTPNKDIYDQAHAHNDFHCSEMTRQEFQSLLSGSFEALTLNAQIVEHDPRWNVDAMAAHTSPWDKVKGFQRMKNHFNRFYDEAFAAPFRQDPARILNAPIAWGTRLVNPFRLCALSSANAPFAQYFVATGILKPDHARSSVLENT